VMARDGLVLIWSFTATNSVRFVRLVRCNLR